MTRRPELGCALSEGHGAITLPPDLLRWLVASSAVRRKMKHSVGDGMRCRGLGGADSVAPTTSWGPHTTGSVFHRRFCGGGRAVGGEELEEIGGGVKQGDRREGVS